MAADINSVTIVGRLTRDSELKYTPSGFAVSNLGLAVNRSRKDGDQWIEEANFFDVTLLGRRAESLNQYLQKGTKLAVTGELRQERWEKDGQKRSKVTIQASNIQLLGGNQNGNTGGNNSYNNNYQGNNQSNNFNGRPGTSNHGNNQYNSNGKSNNQSYNDGPGGYEDDIPF